MPIFLAALGGVLINIAGTIAGRVLIALGIGVTTYTGMTVLLDSLTKQVVSAFASLPPEMYGVLSMMRVGQVLSVVTSAIAARLVINGLTSDTFKKWTLK